MWSITTLGDMYLCAWIILHFLRRVRHTAVQLHKGSQSIMAPWIGIPGLCLRNSSPNVVVPFYDSPGDSGFPICMIANLDIGVSLQY